MDKTKFRRIGQLILDCLTAIWLVVLTFLGSSCVSSQGDVYQEVKPNIEFQYSTDSKGQTLDNFWSIPDISGDIVSFLIKE